MTAFLFSLSQMEEWLVDVSGQQFFGLSYSQSCCSEPARLGRGTSGHVSIWLGPSFGPAGEEREAGGASPR